MRSARHEQPDPSNQGGHGRGAWIGQKIRLVGLTILPVVGAVVLVAVILGVWFGGLIKESHPALYQFGFGVPLTLLGAFVVAAGAFGRSWGVVLYGLFMLAFGFMVVTDTMCSFCSIGLAG